MLTDDTLIFLCFMILFILMCLAMAGATLEVVPTTTTFFVCAPGQCAVNLNTGSKRCPQDEEDSLTVDPATEVCSYKYLCDNPVAPYAVNYDGSVAWDGRCPQGVACRCLTKPQCAVDQLVVFNTQDKTFTQYGISHQGYAGSQVLEYNDWNQFCAIKANHLNRLGNSACSWKETEIPSVSEVQTCLASNPCSVGSMAFYPSNPEAFEMNDQTITTIPVACVPTVLETPSIPLRGPCSSDTTPMWNNLRGVIECV